MRARHLALLCAAALAGCAADDGAADHDSGSAAGDAAAIGAPDAALEDAGATPGDPDGTTGATGDTGQDMTGGDTAPTGDTASAGEDADVAAPPSDATGGDGGDGSGGTLPEDALLVDASWLDGPLLYGLSADPDAPISAIGQSAAGIEPMLVRVIVDGDLASIRVVDPSTGEAVPGPDGLVESYPASSTADGQIALALGAPVTSVSIQLYQACAYEVTASMPAGEPAIGDGLLTWPLLETFKSNGCDYGGLPTSLGVNVHWLRRLDANPGFEPRQADESSPFGWFRVAGEGAERITRLPIGPDTEDGSIVYMTSEAFPPDLLPTVTDVLEAWNDALEEVAGVRPFAHEVAPDWIIPWDPRVRFIAWDPSKTQGAVAPFAADPYTGEMFSTRVLLWMGDMGSLVEKYTEFFEKHPDAAWIPVTETPTGMSLSPADDGALPPRVLRRKPLPMRPFGPREIREAWLATGMSLPPEELAREILAQFLVHEIGHNLGLRHNFKGSMDQEHHPEDAPSTTVMDYVVGLGRPGTYDVDAMREGYGAAPADPPAYLYCSDEGVALDPGCAQWDYGHPMASTLATLDSIAAGIDPGASWSSLDGQSQDEQWGDLFRRARQFINSEYEAWDPEAPLSMTDELLGRVVCEPGCATHPWFRAELALYLLYTKHVVQVWWEPGGDSQWFDFPALTEAQAVAVLDGLFTVITTPGEPLLLKQTIIKKLPTSKVPGAPELLDALEEHFMAIAEPSAEDTATLATIKNTKAQAGQG